MTRFERWFLRRLLAKQVRQGTCHVHRITELYQEIHDACKKEYYEDNAYTLSTFLHDLFMRTQSVREAGMRDHDSEERSRLQDAFVKGLSPD